MRRIRDTGKMIPEIQLLCANCHKYANIKDGTKKSIWEGELI